ncbi:MAG: hypothetical protein QW650_07355 [Thermofilum sp.]
MKGCISATMKGKNPSRRSGAVPPIVTVIIVVASVVAAALAAYFIYSTTARGVRQVSLTVIGQPTLYATATGVELRVTFKNDGTADVDLDGSIVIVQNKTKAGVMFGSPKAVAGASLKLASGQSISLVYTASASLDQFPDGALATLQTKDGYQVSFAVAKP